MPNTAINNRKWRLQCIELLRLGLLVLIGGCVVSSPATERLFVFYPSSIRPQAMQQRLSEACPGFDITLYGRYKDFWNQVMQNAPDAVLTVGTFQGRIPGYSRALAGQKNNESSEQLFLLSVGKGINPSHVDSLTIGVVDIMSRGEMDSLMQVYFKQVPHLKRVTKLEDLLPLLTFGMADAILVNANQSEYFTATSNLKFVKVPVTGARMQCPVVLVRERSLAGAVGTQIRSMPSDVRSLFGVDSWK